MSKLTLLVGVGIGYVLGTRAGRESYDKIVKQFNSFAGRPEVEQATGAVRDAANTVSTTAADRVTAGVEKAAAKIDEVAGVVEDKAESAADAAADKAEKAASATKEKAEEASDPDEGSSKGDDKGAAKEGAAGEQLLGFADENEEAQKVAENGYSDVVDATVIPEEGIPGKPIGEKLSSGKANKK